MSRRGSGSGSTGGGGGGGGTNNGLSSSPTRSPHMENLRPIKITVVGDGTVGKTCLLISYTQNSFPEEYIPTVFDNHAKNLTVDGLPCALTLWDTAGQEEYEKLRPLSYPKTDCFILCYAINNPSSLANVEEKWIPELRHHCPKASILLCGTKSDLRGQGPDPSSTSTTSSPSGGGKDLIAEGKKVKGKIKANAFLTCSAKTREGLEEVFIEAVRSIMKQKKGGGRGRGGRSTAKWCQIL